MAIATGDAVPYLQTRTALAILIDDASKGLDEVIAGRVKPARQARLKIRHRMAARNTASNHTKATIAK